ncbi:MAG TPA: hypothetical protein VKA48_05910, partial [Gammaproteobacteria bacterium]|nr:hypothetical protein [Gammaproteobacteria bacterium]
YAQMLRDSVEPADALAVPLADASTRLVRQFLQGWLDHPAYYNYLRAVLSRMFQEAVDEGRLDKNPVREVTRRQAPKRDTYITDDHYRAICAELAEWQARAVDLLYLLSQRPGDVLGLRTARDIDWQGFTDAETGEVWPVIRFTAAKTGQPMEVVMNEALLATVQWFQDWKRRQGLVSPYLICYPKDSRQAGKRVRVDHLSRAFREAVEAAGIARNTYTLRDVRPKSLTDEWVAAGDSDKGGHKTEQMKRYYRRIVLPMRARTNVTNLREPG